MNSKSNAPLLLTPGPVPMSQAVMIELGRPMIHHRSPAFEKILLDCLQRLKKFFSTDRPVLILPSTGTGAMEASVVNHLSPGDEVLSLINGKFGERWAQVAEVYGAKVTRLDFSWGEPVGPQVVLEHLKNKSTPGYRAVLCQACETSTATLNPFEEIAKIVKENSEALFHLDAITAAGAVPIDLDRGHIDVLVAGSQKAFMMPTGLSLIWASQEAEAKQAQSRMPRLYFDLSKEAQANQKGQTFLSSSVTLIRALNVALDEMLQFGVPNLILRSQALSEATRSLLESWGFQTYSDSPSPSVSAVTCPDGLSAGELQAALEKEFAITLSGGQDHLKGKVLRFGHLGPITDQDMVYGFESLNEVLKNHWPQFAPSEKLREASFSKLKSRLDSAPGFSQ